jgi:hypothetical protein
MKTSLLILAIVITYVLGYSYYLWSKLSPIMDDPRASVQLVPYQLKPFDGQTCEINLGFAHFRIPAELVGDPVELDDTLFVAIKPGGASTDILFGPPVFDSDDQTKSAIGQYNRLSGETISSFFELKKRVLRTQPFSYWAFIFSGIKSSKAEALLLALKLTFVYDAKKFVRFYEDDRIGILIFTGSKRTIISVHDKNRETFQNVFFENGLVPIDPMVACLVTSYTFTSHASSQEEMIATLRASGIRSVSSASLRRSPGTSADQSRTSEAQHLRQIVDEISRRRGERAGELQK